MSGFVYNAASGLWIGYAVAATLAVLGFVALWRDRSVAEAFIAAVFTAGATVNFHVALLAHPVGKPAFWALADVGAVIAWAVTELVVATRRHYVEAIVVSVTVIAAGGTLLADVARYRYSGDIWAYAAAAGWFITVAAVVVSVVIVVARIFFRLMGDMPVGQAGGRHRTHSSS